MNKEVFIISVGIAFLLQIIHSIRTKGWRFTLEFFGVGLIFGFVREYFYINYIHTYEFPQLPMQLMNVPVFIPIGWVFTFYLAHEFVNMLIRPRTQQNYKDFIIFAMFFASFICIPIETAAQNMNWWSLLPFPVKDYIIAPVGLMGGWMSASMFFFYIYFSMKRKLPKGQYMFIVFILIVLLSYEFKLIAAWGLAGLLIRIAGFLCMFIYNKELTLILLALATIISNHEIIFNIISNGTLVNILFVFIFIYILLKLRYMYIHNQLNIEKSL